MGAVALTPLAYSPLTVARVLLDLAKLPTGAEVELSFAIDDADPSRRALLIQAGGKLAAIEPRNLAGVIRTVERLRRKTGLSVYSSLAAHLRDAAAAMPGPAPAKGRTRH